MVGESEHTEIAKRLDPEVRRFLDAYMEHRRRSFFIAGASTVIAVIATFSSFLYFVYGAVQDKAESAAISTLQNENVVKVINDQLKVATDATTTAIKKAAEAESNSKNALNSSEEAHNKLQEALIKVNKSAEEATQATSGVKNRATEIQAQLEQTRAEVESITTKITEESIRAKNLSDKSVQDVTKSLERVEKLLIKVSETERIIQQVGGVTEITRQISTLKQDRQSVEDALSALVSNTELSQRLSIPSGAILAFDHASGCPAGWEDFKDGAGRVIVGAGNGTGLSNRAYRALGGEEAHTLTIEEMPKHNHGMTDSLDGTALQFNGRYPIPTRPRGQDPEWSRGGNRPHNNMQPFVALFFCKKN